MFRLTPKPKVTTYAPYEIEETTVTTSEYPRPYTENPASYGHEFNLIRAVQEFGPKRVEEITKRIADLEKEQKQLATERDTLLRLIAAVPA